MKRRVNDNNSDRDYRSFCEWDRDRGDVRADADLDTRFLCYRQGNRNWSTWPEADSLEPGVIGGAGTARDSIRVGCRGQRFTGNLIIADYPTHPNRVGSR